MISHQVLEVHIKVCTDWKKAIKVSSKFDAQHTFWSSVHLEGDIFLIFWFVNSLPHFARVGNYSFLRLLKNLMFCRISLALIETLRVMSFYP